MYPNKFAADTIRFMGNDSIRSQMKNVVNDSKKRRQQLAEKFDEKSKKQPVPVPDIKEQKAADLKKKINIGQITLDYLEYKAQDKIKEEPASEIIEKLKVEQVRFRLSLENINKFNKITRPFGYKYKDFGRDRKLQYLISFHEKESERSKKQINLLLSVVKEFDDKLNKYMKKFKGISGFVENEESLQDLLAIASKIELILKIQCFNISDLIGYISDSKIRSIEFAKNWSRRVNQELNESS